MENCRLASTTVRSNYIREAWAMDKISGQKSNAEEGTCTIAMSNLIRNLLIIQERQVHFSGETCPVPPPLSDQSECHSQLSKEYKENITSIPR